MAGLSRIAGIYWLDLVLRHGRSSGMAGYQSCSIATRLGGGGLALDWLGRGKAGEGGVGIRGGCGFWVWRSGEGEVGWREFEVAVKQMFYHKNGDACRVLVQDERVDRYCAIDAVCGSYGSSRVSITWSYE